MKINGTILLLLLVCLQSFGQFSYINPLPESKFHNPQTNILLKNGTLIDDASITSKDLVEIYGSKSGKHTWKAQLSDDGETVIIKPDPVFEYGEKVFVEVSEGLRKKSGEKISGISFSFDIREAITEAQRERYRQSDLEIFKEEFGFGPQDGPTYPLDSMPNFTISTNNNPAPGQIFYCNQQELDEDDSNSFPTIIENDGTIIWARDCGKDGHDFKINKNGYLTYYVYSSSQWIIMDSNYNAIDAVQCKNGYEEETNGHDMQMYPDGHTFLLAYDNITTNMTAYGGLSDATVKGLIIQELDINRDVVFEWRGIDHFPVTDAIAQNPLTGSIVDYCHGNSVERDNDGNILISCRNMSELAKINHTTGDLMWRMGGENNQFTFVNDNIPEHFSEQHDFRRLDNGNISIFNNANFLPHQVSSAKEYSLNEVNKVATLVWYYEHPDVAGEPVYGRASGNAQKLPNGNWMINWGTIFWNKGIPSMTEVDANKNIVWEMTYDEAGQKSYRVHKYDWRPCSRITSSTMKVAFAGSSKTKLSWQTANGAKLYQLDYRLLGAPNWTTIYKNKAKIVLIGLIHDVSYEWRVKTYCSENPLIASGYSTIDTFINTFKITPDVSAAETNDFMVYPVPAKDEITIAYEQPGNAQILIRNSLGSVVFSRNEVSADETTVQIKTDQWPAGIYFVEVKSDISSQTRKIIIE